MSQLKDGVMQISVCTVSITDSVCVQGQIQPLKSVCVWRGGELIV